MHSPSGRPVACRFAWLVFFLAVAGTAGASPLQRVYWAGIAFTGSHGDRASVAPQTSAAIELGGAPALNQRLIAALGKTPPLHLRLIPDELARLDGSTSAVVLAAAFDREKVSIESIGGQYKVLVEIAVQGLFFDFRERQIIASYPLTLQRIDVTARPPTPDQIRSLVHSLVYGEGTNDLAQAFARTLVNARLADAAGRRLQVVGVTFADGLLDKLPTAGDAGILKSTLAHEFSKHLSASTGVGLLPSASGEAVGGAMAARFADGAVYQLRIPAPDYAIRIRIDGLRNGMVSQTPSMQTLLFGAFFTVQVEEPLSKKLYFDQPLRKGATKVVPASQDSVDTWSASYDTLIAGFDAFAGVAAQRSDSLKWLAEQKPGGRPLQQQVQALQELIRSCR